MLGPEHSCVRYGYLHIAPTILVILWCFQNMYCKHQCTNLGVNYWAASTYRRTAFIMNVCHGQCGLAIVY